MKQSIGANCNMELLNFETPQQILQLRLPRTNSNVHSSLPKIDSGIVEELELEVFGLPADSHDFVLIFSGKIGKERSLQDVVIPVSCGPLSKLLFRPNVAQFFLTVYADAEIPEVGQLPPLPKPSISNLVPTNSPVLPESSEERDEISLKIDRIRPSLLRSSEDDLRDEDDPTRILEKIKDSLSGVLEFIRQPQRLSEDDKLLLYLDALSNVHLMNAQYFSKTKSALWDVFTLERKTEETVLPQELLDVCMHAIEGSIDGLHELTLALRLLGDIGHCSSLVTRLFESEKAKFFFEKLVKLMHEPKFTLRREMLTIYQLFCLHPAFAKSAAEHLEPTFKKLEVCFQVNDSDSNSRNSSTEFLRKRERRESKPRKNRSETPSPPRKQSPPRVWKARSGGAVTGPIKTLFEFNLSFMLKTKDVQEIGTFIWTHSLLSFRMIAKRVRNFVANVENEQIITKEVDRLLDMFYKLTLLKGPKISQESPSKELKEELSNVIQSKVEFASINLVDPSTRLETSLAIVLDQEAVFETLLLVFSLHSSEELSNIIVEFLLRILGMTGGVSYLCSKGNLLFEFMKLFKSKIKIPEILEIPEENFNDFLSPNLLVRKQVLGHSLPKSQSTFAQMFFFLRRIIEVVSTVDELYNCLLGMEHEEDLVRFLIKLKKIQKQSSISRQAFLSVFKEPHFLEPLLLIFKTESPDVLTKVRLEVGITAAIFSELLSSDEYGQLIPFHESMMAGTQYVLKMAKTLINDRPMFQFEEKETKVIEGLETTIKLLEPFTKVREDFTGFMSTFQVHAKYIPTNINTTLANKKKQNFFNVEREFPKSFKKKYFAKLCDYFSYFKIGGEDNEQTTSLLGDLRMFNVIIRNNPSSLELFVEGNLFDISHFLTLVFEMLLCSLFGPGNLSRNLRTIFGNISNSIAKTYFQLLQETLNLFESKIIFEEENEELAKEYDNVELFTALLNILVLLREYHPQLFVELSLAKIYEISGKKDTNETLKKVSIMVETYFDKPTQLAMTRLINSALNILDMISSFPGSQETFILELICAILTKPTGKEVYFVILAIFCRETTKSSNKEKLRKLLWQYFDENVRINKKSNQILIQKHGSNVADSIFNLYVVEKGNLKVLDCFIENALLMPKNEVTDAIVLFLSTLVDWKDHKLLLAVYSSLTACFHREHSSHERNNTENILKKKTALYIISKLSVSSVFQAMLIDRSFYKKVGFPILNDIGSMSQKDAEDLEELLLTITYLILDDNIKISIQPHVPKEATFSYKEFRNIIEFLNTLHFSSSSSRLFHLRLKVILRVVENPRGKLIALFKRDKEGKNTLMDLRPLRKYLAKHPSKIGSFYFYNTLINLLVNTDNKEGISRIESRKNTILNILQLRESDRDNLNAFLILKGPLGDVQPPPLQMVNKIKQLFFQTKEEKELHLKDIDFQVTTQQLRLEKELKEVKTFFRQESGIESLNSIKAVFPDGFQKLYVILQNKMLRISKRINSFQRTFEIDPKYFSSASGKLIRRLYHYS